MRMAMLRSISSKAVALVCLSFSAHASIIYDSNSIVDTVTGRSWRVGQIPTATFIATDGWSVATVAEVNALVANNPELTSPAPWSPLLATIFDSNFIYEQVVATAACTGPENGGDCFNFIPYNYEEVQAGTGLWAVVANPVLPAANFGPGYSIGGNVPWTVSTVPALEVTPVPIPGAAGLLLMGLSGLGLWTRRAKSALA